MSTKVRDVDWSVWSNFICFVGSSSRIKQNHMLVTLLNMAVIFHTSCR